MFSFIVNILILTTTTTRRDWAYKLRSPTTTANHNDDGRAGQQPANNDERAGIQRYTRIFFLFIILILTITAFKHKETHLRWVSLRAQCLITPESANAPTTPLPCHQPLHRANVSGGVPLSACHDLPGQFHHMTNI